MKTSFITASLISFGLMLSCSDYGSFTGPAIVPGVDPNYPDPSVTSDTTDTVSNTTTPDAGPPGPPPICPDTGKTYTGFGGASLTVGRVEQKVGVDRSRVKPYTALVSPAPTDGGTPGPGEFRRILGNNPVLLTNSASTYDSPPDRWFQEPQGSAVNLYTSFRVGLQGCTTSLTDAKWSIAPTDTTARAECSAFMRRAWSRTPTADEIDQCVQFAMNETLTELTNSAPVTRVNTTPVRRWAYTCATVLTAAGFITY